jgi:hypothetical protein
VHQFNSCSAQRLTPLPPRPWKDINFLVLCVKMFVFSTLLRCGVRSHCSCLQWILSPPLTTRERRRLSAFSSFSGAMAAPVKNPYGRVQSHVLFRFPGAGHRAKPRGSTPLPGQGQTARLARPMRVFQFRARPVGPERMFRWPGGSNLRNAVTAAARDGNSAAPDAQAMKVGGWLNGFPAGRSGKYSRERCSAGRPRAQVDRPQTRFFGLGRNVVVPPTVQAERRNARFEATKLPCPPPRVRLGPGLAGLRPSRLPRTHSPFPRASPPLGNPAVAQSKNLGVAALDNDPGPRLGLPSRDRGPRPSHRHPTSPAAASAPNPPSREFGLSLGPRL